MGINAEYMGSIISTFKLVSSFRFKMMFYLLVVVPLVWGGTLPGSPDLLLGPGGHYEHPIDPDYYSQNEVYKIKDKDDCHPVERTVYKDECLPYIEKTCYTQQVEQCKDVYEKNCTSVIVESEHRECFDVTELICKLVENIQYEMVDETYTVQRCTSTAGTRRRLSRTGPACSASTLIVASTRIRMAREQLSVRRCPRRSAMTPQERSEKKIASLCTPDSVRSSPTNSLCPSRSKTVTP